MHYPQLPDITFGALAVNATDWRILADDFLCTQSGPITGIHIWGSWLNDFSGTPTFTLGIWSDIPKGDPDPTFSHPGNQEWWGIFSPGQYEERLYAEVPQDFYDPSQNQVTGTCSLRYQYNFGVDPQEAFTQEKGTVYWLSVETYVPGPNAYPFGWNTSADHWNDAAVWGLNLPATPPLVWQELRYPAAQGLDLAFVMVPEPASGLVLVLGLMRLVGGRRKRMDIA